jgi:hypothetical protein
MSIILKGRNIEGSPVLFRALKLPIPLEHAARSNSRCRGLVRVDQLGDLARIGALHGSPIDR